MRIRGTTMQVEKKLTFLLFAGFGLKILPGLNIKAVHNLKPKVWTSSSHHGLCLCQFPNSTIFGF